MKIITAVLIVLLLSACGDGSDSSKPVQWGTVTGVAFDSLISNATVRIYDFSSGTKGTLLADFKTDSAGLFSTRVQLKSKPILVEITNGSYTEEASGGVLVNLNPTHRLTVLIDYKTGDALQVAATSYTHLATGLAEYMIKNGKSVSSAIEEANSRISAWAGFDIVKTIPKNIADVNNLTTTVTPEIKYGFLAGAISMWTKDHAPSPSLEHFYPYSSIDFAKLIYEDISADGILDGYGVDANGVKTQLVFAATALNSEVYRFQLGADILKVSAGSNNKTTLNGAALLPFAQSYIASTDSIFNNVAPSVFVAPLISINSPFDGSWMRNNINIAGTVTSKVDLSKIELLMDGVSVFTQLINLNSPSFNLDTLLYSDGGHDLSIRATNISDMVSVQSIRLNISNTPAAISITNPTNGIWTKGVLAIQATATSPVSLANSNLFVDGVFVQTSANANLPVFTLDTSNYADGNHVVGITSTDISGLASTANIQIGFDNAAPVVTITSPVVNTWQKGVINIGTTITSANFASTAPIDLTKAELLVDNVVIRSITTNLINPIFQLDTSLYSAGQHVVAVRATNSIGKVAVTNLNINFDNIAPVISIQTPSNNVWLTGQANITATVQSAVSITNIELLMDGVSISSTSVNVNSPSFTLNTTNYSVGAHTLGIKANDIGGLTTTTNVAININNTPSVVAITSPAINSWHQGTININTTNTSAVALINTEILIDGVHVASDAVNLANPVFVFDTTSLGNGAHTISIKVTDIAGLITTSTAAVNINNTNPVVNITSPVMSGWIGGVSNISSTVQSAAPITLVELLLDGAVVSTTTSNTTTPILQLNTVLYSGGFHTLGVRATDILGLISLKSQTIYINNTPPTISITSPGAGWLTGTVTISGSATSAAGLSKSEFLIDGAVISTINSSTLTPSLQIAASSYSGVHTIGIRVTDVSGLVTTNTKSASIDGTPPSGNVNWVLGGASLDWCGGDTVSGFAVVYFYTSNGTYSSGMTCGTTLYNVDTSGGITPSTLYSVYVYDVAGNSTRLY